MVVVEEEQYAEPIGGAGSQCGRVAARRRGGREWGSAKLIA